MNCGGLPLSSSGLAPLQQPAWGRTDWKGWFVMIGQLYTPCMCVCVGVCFGQYCSRMRLWGDTDIIHTWGMLVSSCVSVHPKQNVCGHTFSLPHCSRQGYDYNDHKKKLGAIALATVIMFYDCLPSLLQPQHPPHLPTDTSHHLNFIVDYAWGSRQEKKCTWK